MRTFSRSWQLFKSTWAVLMADKELAFFPILGALVTIVISTLILGGGMALLSVNPELGQTLTAAADAAAAGEGDTLQMIGFFLVLFFYYLVMSFIATYFMTGLAGAALKRFEGGDPTFGDGMRIANSRIGSIFGYAVISATVGVVLSALRSRDNAGGRIAASLGDAAWGVVTFLTVPVIAAKGVSPIDAIKESGALLRRTWGQQIVGSAGIGLVLGLLMFATIALGVLLAILAIDSIAAVITIILVTLLIFATLATVNSSLNGIYRAAVYHYADSGEVAKQYSQELIETAFKAEGAKGAA